MTSIDNKKTAIFPIIAMAVLGIGFIVHINNDQTTESSTRLITSSHSSASEIRSFLSSSQDRQQLQNSDILANTKPRQHVMTRLQDFSNDDMQA